MIDFVLDREAGDWDEAAIASLCAEIAGHLADAGIEKVRAGEVSVLLTGDDQVRALNAEWRDKDRPTNILSFPAEDFPVPDGMPAPLGDLALAYGVCRAEADRLGLPLEEHVRHLLVHGLLHLFGYDHMTDTEAQTMERLEIDLMKTMGRPDPYERLGAVRNGDAHA